jgi:hypothetical protein
MLSRRVGNSRRLVDEGGQEASKSKLSMWQKKLVLFVDGDSRKISIIGGHNDRGNRLALDQGMEHLSIQLNSWNQNYSIPTFLFYVIVMPVHIVSELHYGCHRIRLWGRFKLHRL